MSSTKPTPKPRKPSGFDSIADRAITAMVQMLGDEQQDLEMAAAAIASRRGQGSDGTADVERLRHRALAHRAALEKVGRIAGARTKRRRTR